MVIYTCIYIRGWKLTDVKWHCDIASFSAVVLADFIRCDLMLICMQLILFTFQIESSKQNIDFVIRIVQ